MGLLGELRRTGSVQSGVHGLVRRLHAADLPVQLPVELLHGELRLQLRGGLLVRLGLPEQRRLLRQRL